MSTLVPTSSTMAYVKKVNQMFIITSDTKNPKYTRFHFMKGIKDFFTPRSHKLYFYAFIDIIKCLKSLLTIFKYSIEVYLNMFPKTNNTNVHSVHLKIKQTLPFSF